MEIPDGANPKTPVKLLELIKCIRQAGEAPEISMSLGCMTINGRTKPFSIGGNPCSGLLRTGAKGVGIIIMQVKQAWNPCFFETNPKKPGSLIYVSNSPTRMQRTRKLIAHGPYVLPVFTMTAEEEKSRIWRFAGWYTLDAGACVFKDNHVALEAWELPSVSGDCDEVERIVGRGRGLNRVGDNFDVGCVLVWKPLVPREVVAGAATAASAASASSAGAGAGAGAAAAAAPRVASESPTSSRPPAWLDVGVQCEVNYEDDDPEQSGWFTASCIKIENGGIGEEAKAQFRFNIDRTFLWVEAKDMSKDLRRMAAPRQAAAAAAPPSKKQRLELPTSSGGSTEGTHKERVTRLEIQYELDHNGTLAERVRHLEKKQGGPRVVGGNYDSRIIALELKLG